MFVFYYFIHFVLARFVLVIYMRCFGINITQKILCLSKPPVGTEMAKKQCKYWMEKWERT